MERSRVYRLAEPNDTGLGMGLLPYGSREAGARDMKYHSIFSRHCEREGRG